MTDAEYLRALAKAIIGTAPETILSGAPTRLKKIADKLLGLKKTAAVEIGTQVQLETALRKTIECLDRFAQSSVGLKSSEALKAGDEGRKALGECIVTIDLRSDRLLRCILPSGHAGPHDMAPKP